MLRKILAEIKYISLYLIIWAGASEIFLGILKFTSLDKRFIQAGGDLSLLSIIVGVCSVLYFLDDKKK